MDCIFCKIIRKEISAKLVYEDDEVVAFPDLHPKKPVHILIIPKVHVEEFFKVKDPQLFMSVGKAVQKVISQQKLHERGYKIEINGGGHQDIDHFHIHLLGPMV